MIDSKSDVKNGEIRKFSNATIVDKYEFAHHKKKVDYQVNDGKSIGSVRYLVRMRQHGKKMVCE